MSTKYQSIMWELALKYHGNQMYGKHPYMHRLLQVCEASRKAAKKQGYYDNQVDKICAVAIGHDILEDTECTIQILGEAGIPYTVVHSIDMLTKINGLDYDDYITFVKGDVWALLVKREDTFCNLFQSHKEGNAKRVAKYTTQLRLLYEVTDGIKL